jgi:guanine deaminase
MAEDKAVVGAAQRAWRAAILRFDDEGRAQRLDDGLLVAASGRIVAVGDYAALAGQLGATPVADWRGWTLAPGFVDVHVHYPQLDVIASPAEGLLPWLETYTFPHEARFGDPAYASAVADAFLDELMRHGVTTAMTYCTSHPQSVDAFFGAARRRGLRMVAGKCLMDRNSPDTVRDDTERSLEDSDALIRRWHGVDRLGYALTPRFAPSCTERQMAGAAALARAHEGVWVQTHVAENHDEIAWVAQLFPQARSYLDVYDQLGLLRPRSMYAHCIHLDATDRQRLRDTGAAAAVCPTSNLFLGSGLFDFAQAAAAGFHWGLASDVGGGTSFSPFRTMTTAYEVARLRGVTLSPGDLWHRHTAGGAAAMGLAGRIGNLAVGCDADFVALEPRATPLLARRTQAAHSLDEWLFAMIVLGDDRAVAKTVVAGEPVA